MRIYELAKQKNCSNDDIKKILDELHVSYKSHSSSIPEETLKEVLARLEPKSGKAKVKTTSVSAPSAEKAPDKKEDKPKPKEDKKEEKAEKEEKKKTDKTEKNAAPAPAASKKKIEKKSASSAADETPLESVKTTTPVKPQAAINGFPDSSKTAIGATPETLPEPLKEGPSPAALTTLVVATEPEKLTPVPPKSALAPSPLLNDLPEEIEEEIESYEEAYEEEVYEEKTAAKKKVHKTDRAKGSQKQTEPEIQTEPGAADSVVLNIDPKTPIVVQNGVTVKDLADTSGIPASEIIKKLFLLGMMASINQSLDKDTILIVADEFKVPIEVKTSAPEPAPVAVEEPTPVLEEEMLETRPPVVTIMGHVDHGKTTLLDAIRKSKIVDQESGGITQHIGAYLVPHGNGHICFIDTPGHAAFSSMRSMGANVTDIVVLVVSAADGVQPQTIESIRHAKEAEVLIIVAINKMDANGANPDRVKSQLAEQGLNPEDWGGDTLCVGVSAIKGEGIQALLDAIHLQAELLELKANPKGKAFAIVLESCQTDSMGPMVTVLVKNGLFRVGDALACGHVSGKIKRMENDLGQVVLVAKPSYPVRVFGFSGVPDTGSRVRVFHSDKEAKESARVESEHRRHNTLKKKEAITVDNL